MKLTKNFGIREKILISVIFFLVLVFIIEAFIFYEFFLSGIQTTERESMINSLQRVEGLINNEVNYYSTKLSDWSNWDDTYNYIFDKNQAYVYSNLGNKSLVNIKINFMIFIATNGAIIKEKGVDINTGKDLSVPKDFEQLLLKQNIVTVHKTLGSHSEGIISLKNENIVFASRPILTSDVTGPIRGTLIFAKIIDNVFAKKISGLEKEDVILENYDGKLSAEFSDAVKLMPTMGIKHKEQDGTTGTYYINAKNNLISGFTVIYNIDKKPSVIEEVQSSRTFYIFGNKLILTVLGISGVVYIFSIFFELLMLNKLVIDKITKIKNYLGMVANPNNPLLKIEVDGNDEFADLATNINLMLSQIQNSNEQLKLGSDALKQKVEELEKFKNLTVGRELKMIELKKEIERLKNLAGEDLVLEKKK